MVAEGVPEVEDVGATEKGVILPLVRERPIYRPETSWARIRLTDRKRSGGGALLEVMAHDQ